MPYTNIVYIKLQLKLMRDFRFSDQLNDNDKLVFIALLLLAGDTGNRVPSSSAYIKRTMNFHMSEKTIAESLLRIAEVFPKVRINEDFICWEDFDKRHNYTAGTPSGEPKEIPKKSQRKSKGSATRIEQNRIEHKDIEAFWNYFLLKTKKRYLLTDDRKALIRARLGQFSLAELKKAVDNFISDDWGDRHRYMDVVYCIGRHKNKVDTIEKWLDRSERSKPCNLL